MTKPVENPNSRRGRKVEPELRKAGLGPGRKWVKVMSQYAELFVGIDVAKRTLEVALSSRERLTVVNDDTGVAKLVRDLVKRAPALVVLEATGGYERKVWLALLEAGIPTARVNPRDTYHFAQAHRQLAKNDGLDAADRCCSPPRYVPSPTSRRRLRMAAAGVGGAAPAAYDYAHCRTQPPSAGEKPCQPPQHPNRDLVFGAPA